MKRIVFIFTVVFTCTALFAQSDDVSYPGVPLIVGVDSDIWDSSIILPKNDNITRRLLKGERLLGSCEERGHRINNEEKHQTSIVYDNNYYVIQTSGLRPVGSGRLPENWITAPSMGRMWVVSYIS